jgi:hypothetical protein
MNPLLVIILIALIFNMTDVRDSRVIDKPIFNKETLDQLDKVCTAYYDYIKKPNLY